jgi:hypothetical protein
MFKKLLAVLFIICSFFLIIYGYIKVREIKDCNSLTPRFNQDINNLRGNIRVSIGAQTWGKVKRVYALVDGKPHGDDFYLYAGPHRRPTTMIKTQYFANGSHKIKIVSLGYDDKVICSQVQDVVFNNEISDVNMIEAYRIDRPFYFSALSSSPSTNYTVEIIDLNNTTVYSENFNGNINAVIPKEIFEDSYSQKYEIFVKDSVGNLKFTESFGREFLIRRK